MASRHLVAQTPIPAIPTATIAPRPATSPRPTLTHSFLDPSIPQHLPPRRSMKMLKDGSDFVWPDSAHVEFVKGLQAWKRMTIGSKRTRAPRGEGKTDFLVRFLQECGIERTKKQVASHLQVLRTEWRNMDNPILLSLVDESMTAHVRSLSEPSLEPMRAGSSLEAISNPSPSISNPSPVSTFETPSPPSHPQSYHAASPGHTLSHNMVSGPSSSTSAPAHTSTFPSSSIATASSSASPSSSVPQSMYASSHRSQSFPALDLEPYPWQIDGSVWGVGNPISQQREPDGQGQGPPSKDQQQHTQQQQNFDAYYAHSSAYSPPPSFSTVSGSTYHTPSSIYDPFGVANPGETRAMANNTRQDVGGYYTQPHGMYDTRSTFEGYASYAGGDAQMRGSSQPHSQHVYSHSPFRGSSSHPYPQHQHQQQHHSHIPHDPHTQGSLRHEQQQYGRQFPDQHQAHSHSAPHLPHAQWVPTQPPHSRTYPYPYPPQSRSQ